MIAISESMIKSTRRSSFEDDFRLSGDVSRMDPTLNLMDTISHAMSNSPGKEEEERIVEFSMRVAKQQIHQGGQGNEEEVFTVAAEEKTPQVEATRGQRITPGGKTKTKVVKFEDQEDNDTDKVGSLPMQFTKEAIQLPPEKEVSSSLSAQLSLGVMSRGDHADFSRHSNHSSPVKGPKTGPQMEVKIWLDDGEGAMVVTIRGSCSVHDLIEKAIFQAEGEDRDLEFDEAECYDLRMLDDEDQGTPDMDMPPLERSGDVRTLGMDCFAMVTCDGVARDSVKQMQQANTTPNPVNRSTRAASSAALHEMGHRLSLGGDVSGRTFARILMKSLDGLNHDETHVMAITEDMTFSDILPLITKKKRLDEPLLAQHYNFTTIDGQELGMATNVKKTNQNEFKLVSKMPSMAQLPRVHLEDTSSTGNTYTKELAFAYSEYTVIKTNSRGRKQKRVFGVDENMIYNKPPRASTITNALGIRRTSMSETKVMKAMRPISTVSACAMVPGKDMCFSVTFDDPASKKDKVVTREYKTETITECQEIVDKISFLIQNQQKTRNRVTSGVVP